jgi:hypothetical protein
MVWHQTSPLPIITRGFLPRIAPLITNANFQCQAIIGGKGSSTVNSRPTGPWVSGSNRIGFHSDRFDRLLEFPMKTNIYINIFYLTHQYLL